MILLCTIFQGLEDLIILEILKPYANMVENGFNYLWFILLEN